MDHQVSNCENLVKRYLKKGNISDTWPSLRRTLLFLVEDKGRLRSPRSKYENFVSKWDYRMKSVFLLVWTFKSFKFSRSTFQVFFKAQSPSVFLFLVENFPIYSYISLRNFLYLFLYFWCSLLGALPLSRNSAPKYKNNYM